MKRLASIADKLAIVRSICHNQGNHGAGNHYMMTGAPTRIPVGCGAFVSFHPSLGSVDRARARRDRRAAAVFLDAQHVAVGRAELPGGEIRPVRRPRRPEPKRLPGPRRGPAAGPGRRSVRPPPRPACARSTASAASPTRPRATRPWRSTTYYEQGYDLMSSPDAQRAFDIGNEPDSVRDAYGRNAFGQRAPAGPPPGRGRRAVRHPQRGRLGPPHRHLQGLSRNAWPPSNRRSPR